MLPRFERILGHAEMLVKRHRDQHRIDVLRRKQLAMILKFLRIGPDDSRGLIGMLRVQIAHRNAAPGVDFRQMPQQISTAAPSADEPILHLFIGGFDLLNKRPNSGRRSASHLHDIAAGRFRIHFLKDAP